MNEKNKMGKGDQHVKCYMGRVLMKIFYLFFSRAYCLALFKHTRGILVSILDTLSTEIDPYAIKPVPKPVPSAPRTIRPT